ncbi:MAG: 3-deoxy-D-manno-octulosonic acid transferase, partial [Betaproteobacteria bacterium]|nr:3-deoxy-D-manno-octulosonic acid transferase [Betaproteobacteria bacterium]
FRNPHLPILITCTPEAARRYATDTMQLPVYRLPIDYVSSMRRFIGAQKPRACILLEQELWPNLIAECNRQNIPVVVANGRLSATSARRYATCRSMIADAFAGLAAVAAGDRESARRFSILGASEVQTTGNIKHDARPDEKQVERGRQLKERICARSSDKPVVLLASTRPGEEKLLLPQIKNRIGDWPLIVVPRHIERVGEVEAMLTAHGWQPQRKSQLAQDDAAPNCLIGDTLGEMSEYAAAADIAFVGGSLLPFGGQNPLEQLAVGVPVVMGPSLANIRTVVRPARRAGALLEATDAQSAAMLLQQLGQERTVAATAAVQIAEQLRGGSRRTVDFLSPHLKLD